MKITRLFRLTIGITLLFVLQATAAAAAGTCEVAVGRLATVEGQVEVQQTGMASWQPGKLNDMLCQGDTVRAAERSRATVVLVNQAVLRIDQNTAMRLDNITGVTGERSVLSLLKGALQSFSRKPRGFEINTPYLNGSIEGTEFVFRVEDGESTLTVFEGTVLASNDQGKASVSGGESVAAAAGQAPQKRTVVRPRDAAQWSLYYPPILATGGSDSGASEVLRQAAADLSVGRVAEARASVDQAIADGTGAGLAYALRAVIEVVQNQREQALVDARQGVTLSPDSAAAEIALSYALQANFQITEARDVLQQAVAQHPEDALARARLAELQLMLGDREQATATAQQAVTLAPDLERTQITLGFAALAEFRNSDASAAFERAIALDSADPLPHLGLGLAKISAGNLEAGRSEIELAVGLGSNDALMRAYLGKAYFEEKRAPLDSEQFAMAKQLDPFDPTAFLYEGIAKQTRNQPVEAAQDLQKSIELNDNRAAYRSRLLLDKDRAARGTSLARAYNDLGFEQLGVNESTRSLTIAPSNASAHRFLSDTYRGQQRRELSRLSELYQAQMLQDININPVQPSISTGNLNIVTLGGPATPGFSEFTPLFQQNQAQVDVSAAGGSNNTYAGESVVTVLHDRYSLSLGALKFKTDGFRDNNDQNHEIYNVFGQADITPVLNVQGEYTYRDTTNGDLAQNFDPDNFNPQYSRYYRENTYRLGARLTPSTASTLLLSAIYSDRTESVDQGQIVTAFPCSILPPPPFFPPFPCANVPSPGLFTTTTEQSASVDRDTWQYEGQYLYQAERYNITTGALYSDNSSNGNLYSTASISYPLPPQSTDTPQDFHTYVSNAYVYSNLNMLENMVGTAGVSYSDTTIHFDDSSREDANSNRFNPKLGLQWQLTDALDFRTAYFKTVMPVLANKRMLEPTQVAGFSQFYDDASGTKATNYAGGLDWHLNNRFYLGGELVKRDLQSPATLATSTQTLYLYQDENEWRNRAYAYWMPFDRWSFSGDVVFDKFESDNPVDVNLPLQVKTWSYPVTAQYFHPSGYFGAVSVTYVDQEVDRQPSSTYAEGKDNFTVTDMAIGYRLPRRQGILSLAVQNVFDQEFDYQDNSYRTFQDEPSIGPYIPDRSVMARVTLNF